MSSQECFVCRGLLALVELSKCPSYSGPKIPMCGKHIQERLDRVAELLAPKRESK